jgi:hypothetical protein
MVLYACVQPVNVDTFLKDPKVQDIYNKDKGQATVDIDVDPVVDNEPQLSIGGSPLPDNKVTVYINSDDPKEVTVNVAPKNPLTPYSLVEWYIGSWRIGLGTTSINISTTAPIPGFTDTPGWYTITAVGTAGGKPYSTYFYVEVID